MNLPRFIRYQQGYLPQNCHCGWIVATTIAEKQQSNHGAKKNHCKGLHLLDTSFTAFDLVLVVERHTLDRGTHAVSAKTAKIYLSRSLIVDDGLHSDKIKTFFFFFFFFFFL